MSSQVPRPASTSPGVEGTPGTPVQTRPDPAHLGQADGRISASPSRKYYAVTVGRVPGVYLSPTEADAQVRGFGHSNYR
eukprot:scaffold103947_cov28-Attheya_sp.AAC.1